MPNKDCDCAPCKTAGVNVTRGREGRGRHAREIRTRDSRQSSYDSLPTDSPHLAISPWLAANPLDLKETKWAKPTRRQADDAWVIEHERRMSDLDVKNSQMSISPDRGAHQRPKRTSSSRSYEHIIEADDVEEPEEIEPTPTKQRPIRMLPYEISDISEKASSQHRSRRPSYGSQHVLPYHTEAPTTPRRQARIAPAVSEHDSFNSRELVHMPQHYGSHNEPRRLQPHSCYFDSPLSRSPTIPISGLGHYDIVQNPLRHDAYYPRQYTVY